MNEPATESVSFDRVAGIYDESRGGERRGTLFAQAIAPYLDRESPVLEIGIGTGLVAHALTKAGFTVTGVDLAPAMAARAKARIGPRVAVGDATWLPFGDGCALQTCSVWLLHLTDAQAVLREAGRVLRPGGRYVVVSSGALDWVDDIGAITRPLWKVLPGSWGDPARDGLEALQRLGPQAGLDVAGTGVIVNEFDEAPAETAMRLEQRHYSRLFDLGAAEFERVVRPAIDALRALDDPDRPRRRESRHQLTVLRRG